jgi:hypothetical protein
VRELVNPDRVEDARIDRRDQQASESSADGLDPLVGDAASTALGPRDPACGFRLNTDGMVTSYWVDIYNCVSG